MEELSRDDRAKLVDQFGQRFEAGAALYSEGDDATHCYIVHEGRVRLVKRIRSAERSLTVLRTGDLFGEDALLPEGRRAAAAVALTDLEVLALDRKTFGVLLSTDARVAEQLVAQLVRRLRDAEEQLENAMARTRAQELIVVQGRQYTVRLDHVHVLHASSRQGEGARRTRETRSNDDRDPT
mgnify:CR=1 FL=1